MKTNESKYFVVRKGSVVEESPAQGLVFCRKLGHRLGICDSLSDYCHKVSLKTLQSIAQDQKLHSVLTKDVWKKFQPLVENDKVNVLYKKNIAIINKISSIAKGLQAKYPDDQTTESSTDLSLLFKQAEWDIFLTDQGCSKEDIDKMIPFLVNIKLHDVVLPFSDIAPLIREMIDTRYPGFEEAIQKMVVDKKGFQSTYLSLSYLSYKEGQVARHYPAFWKKYVLSANDLQKDCLKKTVTALTQRSENEPLSLEFSDWKVLKDQDIAGFLPEESFKAEQLKTRLLQSVSYAEYKTCELKALLQAKGCKNIDLILPYLFYIKPQDIAFPLNESLILEIIHSDRQDKYKVICSILTDKEVLKSKYLSYQNEQFVIKTPGFFENLRSWKFFGASESDCQKKTEKALQDHWKQVVDVKPETFAKMGKMVVDSSGETKKILDLGYKHFKGEKVKAFLMRYSIENEGLEPFLLSIDLQEIVNPPSFILPLSALVLSLPKDEEQKQAVIRRLLLDEYLGAKLQEKGYFALFTKHDAEKVFDFCLNTPGREEIDYKSLTSKEADQQVKEAVQQGQRKHLKFLLDVCGFSAKVALQEATIRGQTDILYDLVEERGYRFPKKDLSSSCLSHALFSPHGRKLLEWLEKKGVALDQKIEEKDVFDAPVSILDLAYYGGLQEEVGGLVAKKIETTVNGFFFSVLGGHFKWATELLSNNASKKNNWLTSLGSKEKCFENALGFALQANNKDLVSRLLREGSGEKIDFSIVEKISDSSFYDHILVYAKSALLNKEIDCFNSSLSYLERKKSDCYEQIWSSLAGEKSESSRSLFLDSDKVFSFIEKKLKEEKWDPWIKDAISMSLTKERYLEEILPYQKRVSLLLQSPEQIACVAGALIEKQEYGFLKSLLQEKVLFPDLFLAIAGKVKDPVALINLLIKKDIVKWKDVIAFLQQDSEASVSVSKVVRRMTLSLENRMRILNSLQNAPHVFNELLQEDFKDRNELCEELVKKIPDYTNHKTRQIVFEYVLKQGNSSQIKSILQKDVANVLPRGDKFFEKGVDGQYWIDRLAENRKDLLSLYQKHCSQEDWKEIEHLIFQRAEESFMEPLLQVLNKSPKDLFWDLIEKDQFVAADRIIKGESVEQGELQEFLAKRPSLEKMQYVLSKCDASLIESCLQGQSYQIQEDVLQALLSLLPHKKDLFPIVYSLSMNFSNFNPDVREKIISCWVFKEGEPASQKHIIKSIEQGNLDLIETLVSYYKGHILRDVLKRIGAFFVEKNKPELVENYLREEADQEAREASFHAVQENRKCIAYFMHSKEEVKSRHDYRPCSEKLSFHFMRTLFAIAVESRDLDALKRVVQEDLFDQWVQTLSLEEQKVKIEPLLYFSVFNEDLSLYRMIYQKSYYIDEFDIILLENLEEGEVSQFLQSLQTEGVEEEKLLVKALQWGAMEFVKASVRNNPVKQNLFFLRTYVAVLPLDKKREFLLFCMEFIPSSSSLDVSVLDFIFLAVSEKIEASCKKMIGEGSVLEFFQQAAVKKCIKSATQKQFFDWLCLAAQGSFSLMQYLITEFQDQLPQSPDFNRAFKSALLGGNLPAARFLIVSYGIVVGEDSMNFAAQGGDKHCVQWLGSEYGVLINKDTLHWACKSNRAELAFWLMKDKKLSLAYRDKHAWWEEKKISIAARSFIRSIAFSEGDYALRARVGLKSFQSFIVQIPDPDWPAWKDLESNSDNGLQDLYKRIQTKPNLPQTDQKDHYPNMEKVVSWLVIKAQDPSTNSVVREDIYGTLSSAAGRCGGVLEEFEQKYLEHCLGRNISSFDGRLSILLLSLRNKWMAGFMGQQRISNVHDQWKFRYTLGPVLNTTMPTTQKDPFASFSITGSLVQRCMSQFNAEYPQLLVNELLSYFACPPSIKSRCLDLKQMNDDLVKEVMVLVKQQEPLFSQFCKLLDLSPQEKETFVNLPTGHKVYKEVRQLYEEIMSEKRKVRWTKPWSDYDNFPQLSYDSIVEKKGWIKEMGEALFRPWQGDHLLPVVEAFHQNLFALREEFSRDSRLKMGEGQEVFVDVLRNEMLIMDDGFFKQQLEQKILEKLPTIIGGWNSEWEQKFLYLVEKDELSALKGPLPLSEWISAGSGKERVYREVLVYPCLEDLALQKIFTYLENKQILRARPDLLSLKELTEQEAIEIAEFMQMLGRGTSEPREEFFNSVLKELDFYAQRATLGWESRKRVLALARKVLSMQHSMKLPEESLLVQKAIGIMFYFQADPKDEYYVYAKKRTIINYSVPFLCDQSRPFIDPSNSFVYQVIIPEKVEFKKKFWSQNPNLKEFEPIWNSVKSLDRYSKLCDFINLTNKEEEGLVPAGTYLFAQAIDRIMRESDSKKSLENLLDCLSCSLDFREGFKKWDSAIHIEPFFPDPKAKESMKKMVEEVCQDPGTWQGLGIPFNTQYLQDVILASFLLIDGVSIEQKDVETELLRMRPDKIFSAFFSAFTKKLTSCDVETKKAWVAAGYLSEEDLFGKIAQKEQEISMDTEEIKRILSDLPVAQDKRLLRDQLIELQKRKESKELELNGLNKKLESLQLKGLSEEEVRFADDIRSMQLTQSHYPLDIQDLQGSEREQAEREYNQFVVN